MNLSKEQKHKYYLDLIIDSLIFVSMTIIFIFALFHIFSQVIYADIYESAYYAFITSLIFYIYMKVVTPALYSLAHVKERMVKREQKNLAQGKKYD